MPNQSILRRFNEKYTINPETGCWEWIAAIYRYGKINIGNKKIRPAHRISYELFIGEIPDGMCVCHKCDNTKCVSPFHLFLGTQQDNMDDMYKKGRRKKMDCPSISSYMAGCRCDGCKQVRKEYFESMSPEKKALIKAKRKEYVIKNAEKFQTANKEYYEANKEKAYLRVQLSRQRKKTI